MSDAAAQTVLSFYSFPPGMVRRIESLGNAGGWSGAELWRVTDAGGRQLCLRKYPRSNHVRHDLALIHGVLRHVARELPAVACPLSAADGATHVEYEGRSWEMCEWRAGTADFRLNPSRVRLRAAMQSLGWFHILAAQVVRPKEFSLTPAISDRIREYQHHRFGRRGQGGLAAIERSIENRLGNEIDLRASRLLGLASRSLLSTQFWGALEPSLMLWHQPAIRDIHHDHVLFTGDEVTGLIDFDAMRIDTPLTDIARLVGSLVGDDQEARRSAFDAYSELRPLSDKDREIIDALDRTGTVLAGLNWLTWLYVDRRDMGPPEPIIRRLDEILRRLELMAAR